MANLIIVQKDTLDFFVKVVINIVNSGIKDMDKKIISVVRYVGTIQII